MIRGLGDESTSTYSQVLKVHVYIFIVYIYLSHVLAYSEVAYNRPIFLQLSVLMIEFLFVFVGAVFVAPRSEELGIAT